MLATDYRQGVTDCHGILRTIIILAFYNQDLSRKRHICVTDIVVTDFTNFDRHGCLTVTGFTNTRREEKQNVIFKE